MHGQSRIKFLGVSGWFCSILFVVLCNCWFGLCCILYWVQVPQNMCYAFCGTWTQYNIQHNPNQQLNNMTNNIEQNQPLMRSSLSQCWTPYAVTCNLRSWRWAYRCPKHVEIFMIINHNCCIKLVPLVIRLAVRTFAITILCNLLTGWSRAAPWCFSACEGIALELSLKLMLSKKNSLQLV
jgi:hypothetical protein